MNWQYSFVGLALAWLNGPVVKALGCYSVLPGSKTTTWKPGLHLLLDREASLQRPELSRPPRKVIGKRIRNRVSLMKSLLWRSDVSLPKGRSIEKISASYMCLGFVSSSLSKVPSDRTMEKIPSQARTASSMFCFSCRFLLRLVVLVTGPQSLWRG